MARSCVISGSDTVYQLAEKGRWKFPEIRATEELPTIIEILRDLGLGSK